MREIQQFVTNDPGQLSTQLSKFENNVVQETEAIRATYAPVPVPTKEIVLSGTTVYQTGQAVVMNYGFPGALNIAGVPGTPGWLAIIRKSNGTYDLTPPAGVLINKATSVARGGSVGIDWVFYDGKNFWV